MAAQRRNEIGVRMALGAVRGSVIGFVMREAGFLLMIGLIAETALALDGARRLHSAIRPQTVRPCDARHRVRSTGRRRRGGKLCAGTLRIPPRSDARLARGIGF